MSERKLTEQQWRDLDDLRRLWSVFCDADPVPIDFIERMERAGYSRLRRVRKSDLEESFAAERGIEKGGALGGLAVQRGMEHLPQPLPAVWRLGRASHLVIRAKCTPVAPFSRRRRMYG